MTYDIVAYPLSLIEKCREEAAQESVSEELNELVFSDYPRFSDKVGDSFGMYMEMCEALEGADSLEFDGKDEFVNFFNSFLNHSLEGDYEVKSIGVINQLAMAVISPDRVDHLASLIPRISVSAWTDEYRKQPQAAENVESGFLDDEIVGYLNELCKFVAEVAGKGNCLGILGC